MRRPPSAGRSFRIAAPSGRADTPGVSEAMPDVAAWAREHGVNYEVEPLIELVEGRQVQVGFALNLYARLPMDERPRSERWLDEALIRGKLHALLKSLAPPPGGRGRLQMQPDRAAAFLNASAGMAPEIVVTAHVFHGDQYFAPVTEDERTKVNEAARKLSELGVPARGSAAR